MIRTFPNLKITDKNGNIVYMDSLLDIQPYYLKVHDKNNKNSGDVEEEIMGEWWFWGRRKKSSLTEKPQRRL